MTYLLFSILCSSAIFLIFKAFDQYKINNLQAIVINYMTAGLVGLLHNKSSINIQSFTESDWVIHALILGTVFISLFNIMALTAQRNGASVAAIANKMALIIPVCFAWLFLDEPSNGLSITGVLLALAGVYFSSHKNKGEGKFNIKALWLPFVLFIGSGFIDTFLKFTEEHALHSDADSKSFTALTFLTAFTIGTIVLALKKNLLNIQGKTVAGGVILGVINYGSIYFIIQCLATSGWLSSTVFPINNVGVVLLTIALAILLFKEKLSLNNKVGIVLSILSIVLIAISE